MTQAREGQPDYQRRLDLHPLDTEGAKPPHPVPNVGLDEYGLDPHFVLPEGLLVGLRIMATFSRFSSSRLRSYDAPPDAARAMVLRRARVAGGGGPMLDGLLFADAHTGQVLARPP